MLCPREHHAHSACRKAQQRICDKLETPDDCIQSFGGGIHSVVVAYGPTELQDFVHPAWHRPAKTGVGVGQRHTAAADTRGNCSVS